VESKAEWKKLEIVCMLCVVIPYLSSLLQLQIIVEYSLSETNNGEVWIAIFVDMLLHRNHCSLACTSTNCINSFEAVKNGSSEYRVTSGLQLGIGQEFFFLV
jgi:hypothetical protein